MSLKLNNSKKYLRDYSQNLLNLAYKEIERSDRTRNYKSGNIIGAINASGSLKESLKLRGAQTTDVVYNYSIIGNAYGEAVDEGTKRSTPPVQKLINWLITKNKTLKDSKGNIVNLNDIKKVKRIAFAIQKSLNVNGIQRTGFLTNLVKEQFNELSRIDVPVVQDIIEDLDNILKRNGYKKTGDKFSISIKRI